MSSDGTASQVVTVTINGTNDVPVAHDDTASTDEDTAIIITPTTLLNNDGDVDNDTLTIWWVRKTPSTAPSPS